MFTPASNKLNRSCSESDLSKVNFDNLRLEDDKSENSNYLVTKRVFVVEEVIRRDYPNVITRGSSYHQFIGRSIPNQLHNLDRLSFNNSMVNNQFLNNSLDHLVGNDPKKFSDARNNSTVLLNEGIPMEVDVLHDTNKSLIETMEMDVDHENVTNNRKSKYSNLENVIKRRNPNKTPGSTNLIDLIQGGTSKDTRSKITPIIINNRKKEPSYSTYILILVVAFIFALLYFVFLYDILYVNTEVQNHDIERDLTENVHGQNDSLGVIIRSFQQRHQWKSKIKVLSFVGSTGVGKTFVANVIKRHFLKELAHELFGLHLTYESERNRVLSALRSCCLNLIIVDDLKLQDTVELFAFIHALPEDYFILVLPIFNIQYTSNELKHEINYTDIIEIRNELDNSGLYHELIIFKEFETNEVKDWMHKQLKSENIDSKLRERILESVLTGHEIKYNGLKGLYPKLLLELKRHGH